MRRCEKAIVRKLNGSALIWVISVLAILIIFLLSAVTASTVYATRVSKEALGSQMKYTSRSAVDILVNKYCTGTVYSSSSPSPLDGISVGTTAGPIKVTFNSPEPMNPMGECNAFVRRDDDRTVTIEVVSTYEDMAKETIAAVLRKQSVFDAGLICTGEFDFEENSSISLGQGTAAVLNDAVIATPDLGLSGEPVAVQVFNSNASNMIYTSAQAEYFGTETVFSPPMTSLEVSFDMPDGEYTELINGGSISLDTNCYKFEDSFSYEINLESAKTYYFKADTSSQIDLSISKSGTEPTVVYIDAMDSSATFNLKKIPSDVIIYINGKNAAVNFSKEISELNGGIYVNRVSLETDAKPKITYVNPEGTVSISSNEIDTYIWKFTQYKQGAM